MKKVLIIGANGFVGEYLAKELKLNNYLVYGTDIYIDVKKDCFHEMFEIDIMNESSVYESIERIRPDYIVNLAAISSVKKSWDCPALTFDVNVKGSINILEVVRKLNLKTRVMFIGSSEEYGKIDYSIAVSEENELNPINPYAISKLSQEKIAMLYKDAYDLDIILVRAFNHIGVGQGKGFVVPDFASQIAEMEKTGKKEIRVGNLSAKRDFTDVRDIVKAYVALLEKGKKGEVYNVGSGKVVSIQNILDLLIEQSEVDIEVVIDKSKFREVETPMIRCNNDKIKKDTGWQPEISLQESLRDILEYWRNYV